MNRSIRLIALVAFATSIAACSQAAGSVGDAPTPPATVAPATPVPSASPMPEPRRDAVGEPDPEPRRDAVADGTRHRPGHGPRRPRDRPVCRRCPTGRARVAGAGHERRAQLPLRRRVAKRPGDRPLCRAALPRFYLGRLIDVHTASHELVTPSGASVGMPLTELQRIYGERGTLITGVSANQAFSVHVPDGLGIVFFLDVDEHEGLVDERRRGRTARHRGRRRRGLLRSLRGGTVADAHASHERRRTVTGRLIDRPASPHPTFPIRR